MKSMVTDILNNLRSSAVATPGAREVCLPIPLKLCLPVRNVRSTRPTSCSPKHNASGQPTPKNTASCCSSIRCWRSGNGLILPANSVAAVSVGLWMKNCRHCYSTNWKYIVRLSKHQSPMTACQTRSVMSSPGDHPPHRRSRAVNANCYRKALHARKSSSTLLQAKRCALPAARK